MEDGFDVFKHKCASKFTVLNDFRVCLNQHLFPEVEGIEELEMNDSDDGDDEALLEAFLNGQLILLVSYCI